MTPTTCTGWRIEPAAAKNTAEPPGASAVSPKGVYTESSAIDPTTRRLTSHPIRGADSEQAQAVAEDLADRRGQHQPGLLFRLSEHPVLVVPGVRQAGEALEVAGDAMGLERLRRAGDDARDRHVWAEERQHHVPRYQAQVGGRGPHRVGRARGDAEDPAHAGVRHLHVEDRV